LSSLHIALKCGSYQEAVSENIRCGGDNCSRAIVIGGLFAGANPGSVPEEWMNRLDADLRSRLQRQAELVSCWNCYCNH
jgi:ADP-ribosylglycohydrolase